jgi:hypothetical protein
VYAPKIYLAGKISKNCWRKQLVPDLRDMRWADGPLDCVSFNYVGPFFVGCDHGCYHGSNTHGNLPLMGTCNEINGTAEFLRRLHQENLRKTCMKAIDDCDILFAYIDEHKCYGTISEIEYAVNINKIVIVNFAPSIASESKNDFWFATVDANSVNFQVSRDKLKKMFNEVLELQWIF